MTTYTRTQECEAMQWHTGNDYVRGRDFTPAEIVTWVNDHGGEARYDPEPVDPVCECRHGPQAHEPFSHGIGGVQCVLYCPCPGFTRANRARIAVRTKDGWAYVAPGDWIVKGEWINVPDSINVTTPNLREFTVCDPETFAQQKWTMKP